MVKHKNQENFEESKEYNSVLTERMKSKINKQIKSFNKFNSKGYGTKVRQRRFG